MSPTTTSGLVYPDSADDVQLWTHFQNLAQSIEPSIRTPYLKVYRTTEGSGFNNDGVFRAVSWNGEYIKSHSGMHSTSSQTSRLIAPVSGVYRVDATIGWKADGASEVGTYSAYVSLNGVGIAPRSVNNISTGESNSHSQHVWNEVEMSASDYLEVELSPDTATNRAIHGADTGTFGSVCVFKYVRPLVP